MSNMLTGWEKFVTFLRHKILGGLMNWMGILNLDGNINKMVGYNPYPIPPNTRPIISHSSKESKHVGQVYKVLLLN